MQNVSVYCGAGDDLLHTIYCKGTEGTQDTDNRTSHAERATLFVSVGELTLILLMWRIG